MAPHINQNTNQVQNNLIRINPAKDSVVYYDNGSFWHDISLKHFDNNNKSTNYYNYVVEITPHTHEKMEVNKELDRNPITLDRLYKLPIPFTYGCLPQTYEDPSEHDPILNILGDDDPLDVCDVSNIICDIFLKDNNLFKYPYTGQVKQGVIIGLLSIIDKGFADWKVIVIEKDIYNMLSDVDKNNALNSEVKKILVDWYNSDQKSKVGDFYHEDHHIKHVIEHTHNSYHKKFTRNAKGH